MDVTGLKAWQWMIIGTVAGSVVGFAWTNLPNDLERTGDRNQFTNLVRRSAGALARNQQPFVRNIVVMEPERDPSDVLVYPVKFEYMQPNRPRSLDQVLKEAAAGKNGAKPAAPPAPEYVASGIYAPTPFANNQSVIEFLNANKIPFTDRTGNAKYMPVYYGAAGGFAVIGVLWPGVISLMIRTGLAKPPPPKPKKEKVKHRTGEDVDDMLVKPTVKTADVGALTALNDAMEASLAASLPSGGPRATTPAEAAEPVSIFMSGGGSRNTSDPTEAPVPVAPEEKKDYGGEYYPVAKKVKKHDEPH